MMRQRKNSYIVRCGTLIMKLNKMVKEAGYNGTLARYSCLYDRRAKVMELFYKYLNNK